ncbi:hypothetical protein [Sphingomicrobium lutaoense]|uniref:Cytochrome c5 n=1 Tax=Sphingomicrobium lutaoense TaxID=515949 RepID=A0A839Z4E1_9SPHN|nr:hypothetical protein [Sphingomicrobium lutaoense]MBB3764967.1 cytochrome c5 [Sphingomicrobium lutaoense]
MSILYPLMMLAAGSAALPPDKGDDEAAIASATSAAPASVTADATIVDGEGKVIRKGKNGFTCHAESAAMGPMCNDATWGKLIAALMAGKPYEGKSFGVSYMLAGEGDAPGVSNKDPAATAPSPDNDWIKEGPHMMIILPDPAMLEGISTDPADPVYVMWKGTTYAHLMVRIAEEN